MTQHDAIPDPAHAHRERITASIARAYAIVQPGAYQTDAACGPIITLTLGDGPRLGMAYIHAPGWPTLTTSVQAMAAGIDAGAYRRIA